MMRTGISNHDLHLIKVCLLTCAEIQEAVLFGSRAKGNYKHHSDIDIAIKGNLSALECEALRQALDELPLPYSFDVVAYHEIKNVALKEHIDHVGVVL